MNDQDNGSLGSIRAVDPEANGWHLKKPWSREPTPVDPVHRAMDIFYGIVFRKIIPLNLKNYI
jgi:hypothetical protein